MQLFIFVGLLLILISPSIKAQDVNQINEADKLYEAYNKAKSKFDSFNNNKKTWLYSKATQAANDEYSSFKSNSKYHFFTNSEGSISFSEDSDGDTLIDFSFLTVVPLYQSEDLKDTYFTQISAAMYDQFGDKRIGTNLGVGYRNYNSLENMILGINAFYDYEFSSDHYRVGFGLEMKKDLLDITFNYYEALSSKKTMVIDNVSGTEKALDGFDIEAGHPIPFLPWTKFLLSFYKYQGFQGEDPQGFRYGAELALHDNIDLEAGYNDDRQSDGIDQNYWFAKITYKLDPNKGPTLFGTYSEPISERAFGKRDVKETLLDKVRRSNKIMVERFSNGSFKLSGQ